MGVDIGQYRACIGCFASVFIIFMAKRIKKRVKILVIRGYCDAVLLACLTTYFFWVSLLTRCGDVEVNPGPPPETSSAEKVMRQTRLQSANSVASTGANSAKAANSTTAGGGGRVGVSPSPQRAAPQPTLTDVMDKLNSMGTCMKTLLDDVADIKERFGTVQEEVNVLRGEVEQLKHENQELKDHRDALWNRVEGLERKTDDLECRSKRNNLIFYGLAKESDESFANCETRLNDLFTDRLELPISDTVSFDRIHRLGDKPDAPLIACCTHYRHKVQILKAKNKLKGTNIFIGEDFSQGVRTIRKKLTEIMKVMKGEGKKVSMVYDHLIVDGKKFVLNDDGASVREVKGRGK